MPYAGTTNIFGARVDASDVPAGASLVVVASDPTRENFGQSTIVPLR